jgi:hypothetical protein
MTPCNTTPLPIQNIILDWPDYPGALSYQLQISTDMIFITLIVDVSGLTQSQYIVPNVLSYNTCFYWRWRPILQTGNGTWSQICTFCTTGPSGIKITSNEIPAEYNLYQNYPNPFNPKTNITFDIGEINNQQLTDVKLVLYDILGNEITVLVNEKLTPGSYEVTWDASDYPSGVYLYNLVAGKYSGTLKMILIK